MAIYSLLNTIAGGEYFVHKGTNSQATLLLEQKTDSREQRTVVLRKADSLQLRCREERTESRELRTVVL